MALPKLNDQPKYDLVIPSSQQKIRYRPFLVKEEKVLLLAMESKDQNLILSSILDTIEACILDPVDSSKFTTFDIEYCFTQIRSRSVGEVANVLVKCQECGHSNEHAIKLDDIKVVSEKEVSNIIQLTDDIQLELQYPSYKAMTTDKEIMAAEEGSAEATFAMIRACMSAVLTEDARMDLADESKAEVDAFVDSMTTSQLNMVKEYIEAMPKMTHDAKFTCVNCNHNNEVKLEGMQSFF